MRLRRKLEWCVTPILRSSSSAPVRSVSSRPCSCRSMGSVWRSSTRTSGRPELQLCSRDPSTTLQILEEAGLADALINAGRKLTKVAYYEGRERRAEIDYSRLASSHPYLLVVRQSLLERTAAEALGRKNLEVHWGHRLQGLAVEGATLRAEVATLDQVAMGYPVARTEWVVARSETIQPAYVIGADGYDPAVRRMSGSEMEEHSAGQIISVYEIEATGALPAEVRVILDPDLTSVYYPLEDGRCRWGFQIGTPRNAATMGRLQQLIAAGSVVHGAADPDLLVDARLFRNRLTRSFGKGGSAARDTAHQTAPSAYTA